MATLAFKAESQCSPYKRLFEEEQWQALVQLFHQELYRLNNLTPESVLAIHLQASMSQNIVQHGAGYATLFCSYIIRCLTILCLFKAGISALKPPMLTTSARKEDPLALKVSNIFDVAFSHLC